MYILGSNVPVALEAGDMVDMFVKANLAIIHLEATYMTQFKVILKVILKVNAQAAPETPSVNTVPY